MTITLIRHAPVQTDWETRLRIGELDAWIRHYDRAPIDTAPPPKTLVMQMASVRWIVASSLRRTTDSLARLGRVPDTADTLFDEAPVPSGWAPPVRLRPMQWLIYFRLRALFGSLWPQSSMRRLVLGADRAAAKLIAYAEIHGDVALMGHGALNHFIAKSLKKRGWKPIEKGGKSNWSFSSYTQHISES